MDDVLYSSNFKYAEFSKTKEMLNSDLYINGNNTNCLTSGLSRYRSAPNSIFDELLDYNNHANREFPEVGFNLDSNDVKYDMNLKQESVDLSAIHDMDYVTPAVNSGVDKSFRVLENLDQLKKKSGGISSNLIRQSSSPAAYLPNLVDEIGFGVMTDVQNFGGGKQIDTEVSSTPSRLTNHMNFSSKPSSRSRFSPPFAENSSEKVNNRCQQNGDGSNRQYFSSVVPNDPTSTGLKRNRDGEMKMLSSFNGLNNQSKVSKHYTSGLVHQLSLPSTIAEMETIENFLDFQQDSGVPCKTRAKRGFATHPRSIAERMRRTRISERLKKLQDLFPNMDKQANTADMLDLAVECIKNLQNEVETLNQTQERCICTGRRNHYPTA